MKVIKHKKLAYFLHVAIVASTLLYICPPNFSSTSAADCNTTSCTQTWEWAVEVQEQIGLTVSTGTAAAAKVATNAFAHTSLDVSVTSNNAAGFTLGMTTSTTNTNLTNKTRTTTTLPTLGSTNACTDSNLTTCSGFNAGYWGYALAGDTAYKPMVASNAASQITVLSSKNITESNTDANKKKTVHFGAKINDSKDSGVYEGGVIFTLTSGTSGEAIKGSAASDPGGQEPPTIGDEPVKDTDMTPGIENNNASTQNKPAATTKPTETVAYQSSPSTESATTLNNEKKDTSAAKNYVAPMGALERTAANVQTNSPVTTILMTVAFSAAATGLVSFVVVKRQDDKANA